MCFTIAESSWNKLSADQQQIVSDAAKASADYARELNEQQTNDLVSALEEKQPGTGSVCSCDRKGPDRQR